MLRILFIFYFSGLSNQAAAIKVPGKAKAKIT
jgi:hypothetical protein